MFGKSLLLAIALLVSAIDCRSLYPLKAETNDDFVLARTSDILRSQKRDANDDGGVKVFHVNGKEYRAKFQSKQMSLPVFMLNDAATSEMKSGEHEMYIDLQNHASFTVSSYTSENGNRVETIRGNILMDDGELVLEPHHAGEHMAKRDVDGDGIMTKIYKMSADHILEYKKSRSQFVYDNVHASNEATKVKRQSGPVNNWVELLTVFDYPFYVYATQRIASTVDQTVANFLTGYACQIINVANLCYQRSLTNVTQLKITLYPKYILILKTSSMSSFTTSAAVLRTVNGQSTNSNGRQYLNGDVALDDFNVWLTRQVVGNNIWSAFDSAVLITGQDLYSKSGSNLLGLAPLSGTCTNGTRGMIVEDNFSMDSGLTIAHELAHNLGILSSSSTSLS